MGVPKTPGRYIVPVSKIWRRRQAPAAEKTSVDGRLFALKAGEAGDEELREVYDFLALVAAHDRAEPDSAPDRTDQERYDTFVSSLFRRGSPESSGHLNFLLARSCGRIAVSIVYTVGGEGDEDLVLIGLTVHPELRRRGVGTEVLRSVLPVFRALGRGRIGATVRSGDFERWAWNVGFRPVVRQAFQSIEVSEADAARWEEIPVPVGYRLAAWDDTAPEDLLGPYARARQGFEDVVHPRLARRGDWSPRHIREDEADSAARNAACRVVVAIFEATGEVVGMTETAVFAAEPEKVDQGYTAVVREHQGNGLGRAMKAAMMRRLLSEGPGTVRITTRALGDHMMRVNRSLGYRTDAEYAFVEAAFEQVERTLEALR